MYMTTKTNLHTDSDGYIYLASPYSHEDKQIVHNRFVTVAEVAGRLFKEGVIFFTPITQIQAIIDYGNVDEATWEYWTTFDKAFIAGSKALYILTIDGWECSKGVMAEVRYAQHCGVPVFCLDAESLTLSEYGREDIITCARCRQGFHKDAIRDDVCSNCHIHLYQVG